MIISLCFIAVVMASAVPEACLPLETSPTGLSRNTKFSTSVNTPVYVCIKMCTFYMQLRVSIN